MARPYTKQRQPQYPSDTDRNLAAMRDISRHVGNREGMLRYLALMLQKPSREELISMGTDVRAGVDTFDPKQEYHDLTTIEQTAVDAKLNQAKLYLENTLRVVGVAGVARFKEDKDRVTEEGKRYIRVMQYDPRRLPKADARERQRLRDDLVSAVNSAYMMLGQPTATSEAKS